jgi:hypothetical protein
MSERPSPFGRRLFEAADLAPRAVDRAFEVARAFEVDCARVVRGAFFGELPLLLEVERELALFCGLAVLGKVPPCLPG